ncbi:BatD family protein [Tenacibaculum maritimum]|uniref:Aerotolerance-related exported protein n=1 Tax=Tenacibaculum maritimum NCIMB 2154 TaxID=1349785 RepID=A0A2H1ECN3_9FLAO|nr:BatD family protein [Tenacibaculum maritimum]SFZ84544.1 Aerotolerance-related exported protein [Tenacibaculum maritimum NCIMB 2154]
MTLKFYICLFISLLTLSIQAQDAQLTATVSKNKLGLNQRLRVEFAINKQGADNFTAPNFQNFKVVGGPSQSVSQSWINGKVSFSQSYTYIIQPKRKGELNIPPASIDIDGKTITSKHIKIIVLDAVELPKDPNDPEYVAQQNIHLVAEISKRAPYVGEGIYVEYRLYFSKNVGIYDNAITESPQYNGFWNQEIKRNGTPVKKGTYNGESYRYAVLHKALLIPTKSGKLTIDPMKMDIVVAVPTGRGDFFGNPITKQVRKEFSSAKKTINVKALPLQNKPEGFAGAVGEFSFEVTANKHTLKANESAQIKVNIHGKGNLKLFELPKIETPKALEVYQPERKEKVQITSTGLKGSVYDQYTIVPEYQGKYKIPKLSFSYFNPKEEQYQTISSEDLYIEVLEGKKLPSNSDKNTVIKETVSSTGKNFRYIQTTSNFTPIKTTPFFKSNLFYALLILPLISIPIGIFIAKKKEEIAGDINSNKAKKADKLAKKYLSEAQKQLGKKEAFYESLERALHNYLKAKLGIETSDISREKITTILESKKVKTNTITQFIEVLKDCDFARYTPITNVEMEEEYEKAKQIITKLDKQL